MKNIKLIVWLTLVTLLHSTCTLFGGEKVFVGKKIPPKQRVSIEKIDHSLWDKLLQSYVNEKGEVDYRGWAASAEAKRSLDVYLGLLSTADINQRSSKSSKLAFWINAYNAVTVKGILREYPTSSIKKHVSNFGGYNIWKDLGLLISDQAISLDNMEHSLLRKMSEPRIHFAIVCASHSCPRLLNRAYVPEKIDEQLALNAKNFFANRENFSYDPTRRSFKLSKILSWFGSDFGKNQAEQLKSIAPYLPTDSARQAALQNRIRVSYQSYDWSLNEQR